MPRNSVAGLILAVAFVSPAAAQQERGDVSRTNVAQKGSLLIWPDVRVNDGWKTLIRLENDGESAIDVQCYWLDGNKNRVDFPMILTRFQPVWFDATTGDGAVVVNRFPQGGGTFNSHATGFRA
jgi:hypothetical protein